VCSWWHTLLSEVVFVFPREAVPSFYLVDCVFVFVLVFDSPFLRVNLVQSPVVFGR